MIRYARNARTHSDEQIAQIIASINEWGWTQPVVIDEDGMIIAGHGRIMAAERLGLKEVPCAIAVGWSEAKKRAYVIADNKLALNAGWDNDMLSSELRDLIDSEFDVALTGFDTGELDKLLNLDGDDEDETPPTVEDDDRFLVLVDCGNEQLQQELFEELEQRGLTCKLMN